MKKIFFFKFFLIVPLSLLNAQVLDESFGTDGKVVTELSQGVDGLGRLLIQQDGKIIGLGSANNILKMARYNENGTLDTTFGSNGIAATTIQTPFTFVYAEYDFVLQSNQKILLVGRNNISNQMTLQRFDSNGVLDATFGNNGQVNLNALYPFSSLCMVNEVSVLSNDQIIVVISSQQQELYLVKFGLNGSLDTSFGTNGISTIQAPNDYTSITASDSITLSDSSIVLSSLIVNTGASQIDFCLIKCNSNGTLNTSFANNGFAITSLGSIEDYPAKVMVQTDQKILLCGTSGNKFAIVRYNSNGSIDTTFNGNGIVFTTVGSTSFCTDMIIENDGKILLAGNIIHDFGFVKYNANGTLDTSFGVNGIYKIDFGNSYDYGRSVIKQSNGKYVIGGTSSYQCSNRSFALSRFENQNLSTSLFTLDDIIIYPNPTNSIINIKSDFIIDSIELYDFQGRILEKYLFNENNLNINISSKSKGVYFLKINTEKGSKVSKVIKG